MIKTYFKAWLLVSTLLLSSVAFAKPQPMTLKQTVETRAVSSASISPDGKYIAYRLSIPRETYKDDDGKAYSELHIVNRQGKSRKFVSGKVNVSGVQWSHDSRFIYYLAKRNDDKFKSIYRIAIDGGESEKLVSTKSNISAYSINADASKLVYLAKPKKDKSVKKLKKKGFKARVYEESAKKTGAYLVDLKKPDAKHSKLKIDKHIRSLEFHPDKDQLLMRVAATPLVDDDYMASQYVVYNLKGKQLKAFKTVGKLGKALWSPDGKQIAMIGAKDINDPASGRLLLADVKSEKVTEILKKYQGHVKGIQWLAKDKLAYLGHVGTQSEVAVVDVNNQLVSKKITTGDILIRAISSSNSGKQIAAVANTDKHPNEVFDLSFGKSKRLTDSNPWLADIKMPEQVTVNYKARDGVELQGVLVYPLNYKKSKRYPLILSVHGGPESHVSDGWVDRYSSPVKLAAAEGFAVFFPNYRGSTGRGVEFSKMGQADYAGGEFNDLVDAITHLSNMGLVDKKRVGITGGSYGGYASAWGATALSEHFAASVMFVGISDQLSKFGTTDIPKEMYNVHARNYPWDKWQWMLERSPIYHTDKAKTPILIMHGENDTRVHPSQSMELYRYIKTRTKTPARLVFYPGEGHGNRKAGAQLDYGMRLMRWMSFYLKGDNKATEIPPYELDHKARLEAVDKKK